MSSKKEVLLNNRYHAHISKGNSVATCNSIYEILYTVNTAEDHDKNGSWRPNLVVVDVRLHFKIVPDFQYFPKGYRSIAYPGPINDLHPFPETLTWYIHSLHPLAFLLTCSRNIWWNPGRQLLQSPSGKPLELLLSQRQSCARGDFLLRK